MIDNLSRAKSDTPSPIFIVKNDSCAKGNGYQTSPEIIVTETHKRIETCSTVPCSEIFKANLHILSTIFGHQELNSKWPLCYKTNLSWNIPSFIEVLSFYDYYVLCNYPLSFLEHKKADWFEKNISTGKLIFRSMEPKKCMVATRFK